MNTWKLQFHRFDPDAEPLREALCTLGNGYMGTRGAAPETTADKVHYPGTYIAGVYNALTSDVAGRRVTNEDFVNCPNWLMINYRIGDGAWFNRMKVNLLLWRVVLDMHKGVLSRRMRWQDPDGRITSVENERIVSMANPHLCGLRCVIRPENYRAPLTIRAGLDGMVINANVERYRQLNSKHLEPMQCGSFGRDGVFLQMRTNQSRIEITEAQRLLVRLNGRRLRPRWREIVHGRERIMLEFSVSLKPGDELVVEKLVSVATSRDHGVANNLTFAQETVSLAEDFAAMLKAHEAQWKAIWSRFNIDLEKDPFHQLVLRFHTFHLLQVASTYNEDIDAGLPARGLHGEAYRGHIFWDELFAYPFYNMRAPEITRALLMYRYRRLGAAKEAARQLGYRGAMYPWQSASTGEETTQEVHLNPLSGQWGPDYSRLQRHVSLAIAYNVWTYYYVSGDRDFLVHYGAQMLLEIALFWSSLAVFNRRRQRYEIHGVMGPDEFHEKYPGAKKGGLNNNAYTNVMVVWLMDRIKDLLQLLDSVEKEAVLAKSRITLRDLKRFDDISRRMYVPMDENGIIHQFEGYMDLKELDWDLYRAKYENIQRIDRILKAEGLSPDAFKVSKQADVLMIFYVLNYRECETIFHRLGLPFNREIMRKNYEYYERRTSHGSTLSRVVHAYVAERLGYDEDAWRFYSEAMASDIHDIQGGTTHEGIHVGVMGSTIDLFLRCFLGVTVKEDRLAFHPDMPPHWTHTRLRLRYKDVWFLIDYNRGTLKIKADPLSVLGGSKQVKIPLEIEQTVHWLAPGRTIKIATKGRVSRITGRRKGSRVR